MPYQALTINYNNRTIWILKLSLSCNSARPNPPAESWFLSFRWPAHSTQRTGYKYSCLKRGISQTLHSSISPRLLLPGIFSSSPPPCWLAGWLRVGAPPSSYPHCPPHLLYCVLSTLIPPISFLLFMMAAPLKFSMFTRSVICLSRQLECEPVTFMVKLTSSLPLW